MSAYLNNLAFVVYPYVCLAVFFMGSLARFDRDQYTWKSDSSQMLRTGTLRWGSNLFHIGIIFLFFGHLIGQLMPHWMYEPFISAPQKQLLAIVAGGVAGAICFVGLTLLLYRRIFDPRIRLTSHRTDIAILVILWVQLCLGLVTLPLSWEHRHDAGTMLVLASYLQGIATLQPDAARTGGGVVGVQGAHAPRHDDLPALPVQPAGARVERLRVARLSLPSVSGGAQPPPQRACRPQRAEPVRQRRLGPSGDADHVHACQPNDSRLPGSTVSRCTRPTRPIIVEELRQRACTELLRQAAQRAGLLDPSDAPGLDGSISEAAAAAIDAHIDRAVQVPPPSDETCRRYFAANARSYATGERLHLRHILFAVTPGVDVNALRKRAEATLLDVRTSDAFADAARTLSNCPTGAAGGDLGWLVAVRLRVRIREGRVLARGRRRAAAARAQPLRVPRRGSAGTRGGCGSHL